MDLKVEGVLIVKGDTQQVSEKFKKREFVIEISEEINGNVYTNFGKMQLVQARCDVLDRWTEGDSILVHFNIKGNKWERDGKINYITNLDAWKIEAASQSYAPVSATDSHQAGQDFNKLSTEEKRELIEIMRSKQGQAGSNTAGYTGSQAGASNGYNQSNNFSPSPETIDDLPF